MQIKSEDYGNVCVIAPGSDISGDVSQEIRRTVEQRVEERRVADFVVDFERVGFVDSEGLETLLWLKRKCEDLFGQVKLVNLDDNCRKILEITRLEHRFECHGDLAGALKTMR